MLNPKAPLPNNQCPPCHPKVVHRQHTLVPLLFVLPLKNTLENLNLKMTFPARLSDHSEYDSIREAEGIAADTTPRCKSTKTSTDHAMPSFKYFRSRPALYLKGFISELAHSIGVSSPLFTCYLLSSFLV
ncbi:hypothetical protein L210DRAFT_163357, partial [Boletus edulis BED1]